MPSACEIPRVRPRRRRPALRGARLPVAVAVALALLALAPAGAAASAADVASTSTYVAANFALVQVAHSHLRAAEDAPRRLLAQVTRECPRAALASPQDPESTQMSNEVIGAMVLSAYRLDLPALRHFIAVARPLRWSSSSLDRTVQGYVADLAVLAALAPPHLCADVRAWVAGGYRSLPPSTVAFDARFTPAWVAIGLLPAKLAPFEQPQQHALARRSEAFESDLTDGEARAVYTWGNIMNELGLEP